MKDLLDLIKTAEKLTKDLAEEIQVCVRKGKTYEESKQALAQYEAEIKSREEEVIKKENEIDPLISMQQLIARQEDLKKFNKEKETEIELRIQNAVASELSAKNTLAKLEREIFDFNEMKRVHSITRREFEEAKKLWEEKVAKLGIKID